MWSEIERYLPRFESAVLSVRDAQGYPYIVRCRPALDRSSGVLPLDLATGEALRPGPASLLCNDHDEELWNQQIMLLRGRLDREGDAWVFKPQKFVPSLGTVGTLGMARFFVNVRRGAAAYLKRRGLSRPRIPWDEVKEVKDRAQGPG